MTLEQSSAYLAFALVAAITPGPSNVILTATGSSVGFRRGLPCAFGSATGMGLLLFVAALEVGQLVLAHPAMLTALNLCGAAFLLWLAWRIATASAHDDGGDARPTGFLGAATFQWVNAKGWLVAVGAVGTYRDSAATSDIAEAARFGALFFAAALPCGILWLGFGALLREHLRDPRKARLFNGAMALALAGSVVMILA